MLLDLTSGEVRHKFFLLMILLKFWSHKCKSSPIEPNYPFKFVFKTSQFFDATLKLPQCLAKIFIYHTKRMLTLVRTPFIDHQRSTGITTASSFVGNVASSTNYMAEKLPRQCFIDFFLCSCSCFRIWVVAFTVLFKSVVKIQITSCQRVETILFDSQTADWSPRSSIKNQLSLKLKKLAIIQRYGS